MEAPRKGIGWEGVFRSVEWFDCRCCSKTVLSSDSLLDSFFSWWSGGHRWRSEPIRAAVFLILFIYIAVTAITRDQSGRLKRVRWAAVYEICDTWTPCLEWTNGVAAGRAATQTINAPTQTPSTAKALDAKIWWQRVKTLLANPNVNPQKPRRGGLHRR